MYPVHFCCYKGCKCAVLSVLLSESLCFMEHSQTAVVMGGIQQLICANHSHDLWRLLYLPYHRPHCANIQHFQTIICLYCVESTLMFSPLVDRLYSVIANNRDFVSL